jgi:hypothetical protein
VPSRSACGAPPVSAASSCFLSGASMKELMTVKCLQCARFAGQLVQASLRRPDSRTSNIHLWNSCQSSTFRGLLSSRQAWCGGWPCGPRWRYRFAPRIWLSWWSGFHYKGKF